MTTEPYQYATAKAVSAWSETLPDKYLLCRDLGHTWRPYTARIDDEGTGYIRVMRCARCKTEREQALDRRGLVQSGGYHYPDGYQAPAGTGRLAADGRGALRLESTLRLIQKNGE